MKLAKRILLFLILNFGGLAYGSWLMNNGPLTQWYTSLNKAPWTPPGWVFGIAWTLIMICFSIYLGYLFLKSDTLQLRLAVAFQLVLNVSWNYVFFNQHKIAFALVVISTLTIVVFTFFFCNRKKMHAKSYLLFPYMIWMLIATSLNAYILVNN
ncbi:tryptophan-rich sensory protein [Lacinutrix neustonica]|uniref:Tryptophan-rich sensory protein n=1 Tax=Lacinutrix neustonica TaxID=2980107 RepID=A0A9E8MXF0_9FLAO|nr:TspO/MBR family protein [Lacinutrix neustonica]WAC03131.1 tryptophan-rich sensory protein [Lacinutrix neustonica]